MTLIKFIVLCLFIVLMMASLYDFTHFDVYDDDEEEVDENMYDEEVDDYE